MMDQSTMESNPPDYRTVTYYNRPSLRFDCSYLGTKLGALKLVELISFTIAAIVYCSCAMFKQKIGIFIFVNREPQSEVETTLELGYYFYRATSYLLGISVNLLMWSYIFHIVERYHTIPWYIIESVLCLIFGIMTTIAGNFAIRVYLKQAYNADIAFIFAAVFSIISGGAFLYNLSEVLQRKSKKLPPQTSEI